MLGGDMKISASQGVVAHDAASAAVQAAVKKAIELNIRINAAVVDSGGNLVAFLRMPGAYLHAIDIAIDKAYTAASFGFPTEGWMPVLESSPALKTGLPHAKRLVIFAGGLPIRDGDQLVGGIGVSGGTAEQDAICAQAGNAAIGAK
jgi:uncharacterized protein GlcG (DUF336 family)